MRIARLRLACVGEGRGRQRQIVAGIGTLDTIFHSRVQWISKSTEDKGFERVKIAPSLGECSMFLCSQVSH